MADLDTLRPEVLEAITYCDGVFDDADNGEWACIRAELLRLADECATLKAQSIHPRAQLLIMLGHANDRAERAEAELAALKARIEGSPLVPLTTVALGNGYSLTVSASMSVNDIDALHGKRVRLVVEE